MEKNPTLPGNPEIKLRKKKLVIFFAAIILFFFTSMSKILVPGSVFSELKGELGFSAGILAGMGSAYMYCYAASQLALGLLSSKYGGVRILIFGGGCFVFGSLLFPLLSSPHWMIFARGITGLGAGTVFIALAKLIDDLYSGNFSMVLGITLFIGYLGPVTGGLPFAALVENTSWRWALLTPAIISALALLAVFIFLKGTMTKVLPGQPWKPLFVILSDKYSWLLYLTSSVVFGVYYVIMTVMGKKCLEDFGNFSSYAASLWITLFAVIVAANNILSNVVLKLLGERRKVLTLFAGIACFAGTAFSALAFHFNWGCWIVAGFLLIAIPAGFFSIFGTVAKELHPPELVGLSVAILNFFAFVAIALSGSIAGWVLSGYEGNMLSGISGRLAYPPLAYRDLFAILSILALMGLFSAFFIPETRKKRIGE